MLGLNFLVQVTTEHHPLYVAVYIRVLFLDFIRQAKGDHFEIKTFIYQRIVTPTFGIVINLYYTMYSFREYSTWKNRWRISGLSKYFHNSRNYWKHLSRNFLQHRVSEKTAGKKSDNKQRFSLICTPINSAIFKSCLQQKQVITKVYLFFCN